MQRGSEMEDCVGQPCSCKGEGRHEWGHRGTSLSSSSCYHMSWLLKQEWEQISGLTWVLLEPHFQGRQSVVLGEWLFFLFLKVSLRERDAWGKPPKQWKWNTAFLQSITTWSATTNHTTRSLSKTILCMPSHSHHIPVYLKLSYEIGRIVTATKTQRR